MEQGNMEGGVPGNGTYGGNGKGDNPGYEAEIKPEIESGLYSFTTPEGLESKSIRQNAEAKPEKIKNRTLQREDVLEDKLKFIQGTQAELTQYDNSEQQLYRVAKEQWGVDLSPSEVSAEELGIIAQAMQYIKEKIFRIQPEIDAKLESRMDYETGTNELMLYCAAYSMNNERLAKLESLEEDAKHEFTDLKKEKQIDLDYKAKLTQFEKEVRATPAENLRNTYREWFDDVVINEKGMTDVKLKRKLLGEISYEKQRITKDIGKTNGYAASLISVGRITTGRKKTLEKTLERQLKILNRAGVDHAMAVDIGTEVYNPDVAEFAEDEMIIGVQSRLKNAQARKDQNKGKSSVAEIYANGSSLEGQTEERGQSKASPEHRKQEADYWSTAEI